MFYGSFIPSNCTKDQYNKVLLSTAFEVLPLPSNHKTKGFVKRKITFGVWTVTNFNSLAVVATLNDMKSGKGTSNFSEPRTYLLWPNQEDEKKINACLQFLKHFFTLHATTESDYIPSMLLLILLQLIQS